MKKLRMTQDDKLTAMCADYDHKVRRIKVLQIEIDQAKDDARRLHELITREL